MNKDELIHEIGAMLLEDKKILSRGAWQHLVMVAQVMPGATQVNGFVFMSDGEAVPTSPANFDVLNKFKELRETKRRAVPDFRQVR